MPGPGAEDIGFHGISERGSQGELMILELLIKLMECALAQLVVAFHQERTV